MNRMKCCVDVSWTIIMKVVIKHFSCTKAVTTMTTILLVLWLLQSGIFSYVLEVFVSFSFFMLIIYLLSVVLLFFWFCSVLFLP